MRAGVAGARQWYPTYAVASFVVVLGLGYGGLLWVWRFTGAAHPDSDPGDVSAALGRVGVLGGLGVLVCVLSTLTLISWRMWRLVGSLPADGTVGPGEIEFRVYDTTWRPRAWCGLAVVFVALATLLDMMATLVSSPQDHSSTEALLGLLAFFAVGLGLATVRQWRYQGSPFGGASPPVTVATRPGSFVTSPALGGLVWAAPVMCVRVPGGRGVPVGWDGLDAASQVEYGQNGLVLTDTALLAVTIALPEQEALPVASQTYSDVTMALFMSGIAVRRELTRRLASDGVAGLAAPGTSVSISRGAITGVVVQGSQLSVALANGDVHAYLFNHEDSAVAFAARLAASGIAVTWANQPSRDVAIAGAVPFATGAGAMWSATGTTVSTTGTVSLLQYAPRWIMPRPYPRTTRPTGPGGTTMSRILGVGLIGFGAMFLLSSLAGFQTSGSAVGQLAFVAVFALVGLTFTVVGVLSLVRPDKIRVRLLRPDEVNPSLRRRMGRSF